MFLISKVLLSLNIKIKQIEIMTTITEVKGFKIEFNGSKTYFVTEV